MKKAAFSTQYLEDIDEVETPEGYQEFIKFALRYSDSFCMSVYREQGMNDVRDFRTSRLGYLYNSIIDYEYTAESPVTLGPDVILL